MIRLTTALAAASLVACGAFDPEVGDTRDAGPDAAVSGTCQLADSDPETEVGFEQVRSELLLPRCSCHTIAGGLGQVVGGLDLDSHAAALAGGRSGGIAVVAGKPCESLVVMKTGDTPPFGAQMPLSGVPLSESARQLLVDWIADGAKP